MNRTIIPDDISRNKREDGTLEIYVKNQLAATVTDGTDTYDFASEVLEDMGYIIKEDYYERRATTEVEDKYTFSNSTQISAQTGLIGHLRADMDTDGNSFFSTWFGWNDRLKTQEFKDEFDKVLDSLREKGDILNNRKALAGYCYSNPQARMKTDMEYYGVRVDTDKYSYLFRLCPNKGEYNIYCYCYVKEWLNKHIKTAEKGIRFITPNYKEKFRIPDGDKVRITLNDGSYFDEVCRYIDDYHVEVGRNLYHICEFAERMEQNGNTVIPIRSNLPERCFSVLAETGEMIIIQKGESGYYHSDLNCNDATVSRVVAAENNKRLGVSKIQEECMVAGSMFGWDVPGADPKNYDATGRFCPSKPKDRGDAR